MPTNDQPNADQLPDPDEPGIDADERQRRLDARTQAERPEGRRTT